MDDPKDPNQPKPTAPGVSPDPTGEEPAETPVPGTPTPAPGAPAPEEKEEGGETPPPTPVA